MSQKMFASSAAGSERAATLDTGDGYADNQGLYEEPVTEATPVDLTVGQQLFAAREAKGMSVADVAKMLKLSAHQVLAMEADDWSRLPLTVVRGFVRNYARLLQLNADPLMHMLTALQMPQPQMLDFPAETKTRLPENGKAERRDHAAVFSGLALLLIAVAGYFFAPQDFWLSKLVELTSGSSTRMVAPEKVESAQATPVVAPSPPQQGGVAEAAVPAVLPETTQQAQATQQTASTGGLKLSFSEPSWVEIRDRSGQIIFSQLNPAGSQRDIEGQPPFSLVIGNASHVTVQYQGKLVELSQRSKDDVARLNLD